MSYELIYSEDAEDQLIALPPHLQCVVLDNLERLADDPVTACNSPRSTLWPARQLFQFETQDGQYARVFNVVWRYRQGENCLRILAIASYRVIPLNESPDETSL